MSSIALVSQQAVGSAFNTRPTGALTDRGHTVTYFAQGSVDASNLSTYDAILCNYTTFGQPTLAGFLSDYMTNDSIPVLVSYETMGGGGATRSDGMGSLLGMVAKLWNDPLGVAQPGDLTLAVDHRDVEITDAFYGDEELVIWQSPVEPNAGVSSKVNIGGGTNLITNANGEPLLVAHELGGAKVPNVGGTFDTRAVWSGVFNWAADPTRYGAVLLGIAVEWAVGDYESLVFPL